jgi:hypothetical protein
VQATSWLADSEDDPERGRWASPDVIDGPSQRGGEWQGTWWYGDQPAAMLAEAGEEAAMDMTCEIWVPPLDAAVCQTSPSTIFLRPLEGGAPPPGAPQQALALTLWGSIDGGGGPWPGGWAALWAYGPSAWSSMLGWLMATGMARGLGLEVGQAGARFGFPGLGRDPMSGALRFTTRQEEQDG